MGCQLSNLVDQNAQHKNIQVVYPQNTVYTHQQYQQQGYPNGVQQQHYPIYPVGSYPQNQNGYGQQPQVFNQNQYTQQSFQNYNQKPPQPAHNQYQKQNQPPTTTAFPNKQKIQTPQVIQVTQSIANNPNKKALKIADRRGLMQLFSNKHDNFLTHHLKSQIHFSKYARADLIKRRQILEHNRSQGLLGRGYGENMENFNQFALKAYFQRLMLEIFQAADRQFFQEGKSYDQVRQTIAEKYLFQLYQNKEFVDAGLGKYTSFSNVSQLPLSASSSSSDSALYPILRFLKEKYPQVADKSNVKFPEVKQKKNDVNLLDNFPSKCYSSQNLVNIQTLFSDLKFMIDRSVEQFADFEKDMKAILGQQVLTDSKVKRITKNGITQYSASPVRRVFIKWAQTILQRIPDILYSEAFLEFIKSKAIIADNFYFKSTVQPTTHNKVIEVLGNLLEAAKYQITNLAKRKQFGFYIYDLLRCKTKRNTGEQICELLKKMEQTKVTPSGKKFQVVRIKDRFKTPNRDLMVNFRYGDVIVAEAQLCIDTSDISQKTKKTNKFNHYIYQLERGLFGPTIELMMQYQDFQRKDISAKLQAQGKVTKRVAKQPLDFLKKANRKCFNNHDMLELKGNFFFSFDQYSFDSQLDVSCDYCLSKFKTSQLFHYCYYCTIIMCKSCQESYKSQNIKEIKLRCNTQNSIVPLKNMQQLKMSFSNCPIVIFYIKDSAPNILMKDLICYIMNICKMQKVAELPRVYSFCCDQQFSSPIVEKYGIKEFPTTILFDSDGNPQTTLIGACWSLLEGLLQSQQNLFQNLPKALPLKCSCGNPYQQIANQEDNQFHCLYCGNADKSEGVISFLMGQDRSRLFGCQAGHHRCLQCSFLGVNQPSVFKDYRGKSYLSSKKYSPQLPKCQYGHATIYTKKIDLVKELSCFKCAKPFIFNDDLGAGNCVQCKTYCCPGCIGIKEISLKQIQSELINHTIEATAQQGEKCICNRLFKKVYNTRDYVSKNGQEGQDKSVECLTAVYSNQKRNWKCMMCERQKKDGQLHLACFLCPFLKEQRTNIQFCIECSIGSDLLNKQLQAKPLEIQTSFVCKSNHPCVRTTQCTKEGEMTYNCKSCKDPFYMFTERYYCKSCDANICLQCSKKQLRNLNPPKCLRKCKNTHNLVVRQGVQRLSFCQGCRVTIRKEHFSCPIDACDFKLCLDCSATPPGVDTSANRMKHINQEKVRKQMQDMEKGLVDDIIDIVNQITGQDGQNAQDQKEGLVDLGKAIQNKLNQIGQWFD